LPVSLLQAFSLGVPAIVTDVGGMAEVVRMAQAGIIVSAADPAQMSAAILRMAGNSGDREHFSRNGEETFHAKFTLNAMVREYTDLYTRTPRGSRLQASHRNKQPASLT
jgi:L-malate glycosyltransferase